MHVCTANENVHIKAAQLPCFFFGRHSKNRQLRTQANYRQPFGAAEYSVKIEKERIA
jgi:hypothetical protein